MDQTVDNQMATPEILQRKYRFIRLIGEGANGKTYLAVERVSGEKVAVKQLKAVSDFKSFDLFKREVETMKSVDIDGVPKYVDYVERSGSVDDYYLVQEYIDGKSLLDCIDASNEACETMSEEMVWAFGRRMAWILHSLETQYQPPIIHRDIKPSNILLTDDKEYYLIDFGAVANPERKSLNSTIAGTQGYMAPEQLMGDCTIQSDYYGLGATMLHMLTGVAPYKIDTTGMKMMFEAVIDDNAPETSTRMRKLLEKLLAVKPEDRPKNSEELIGLMSGKGIYDECTQENLKCIERHETIARMGRFLERHRVLRYPLSLLALYPISFLLLYHGGIVVFWIGLVLQFVICVAITANFMFAYGMGFIFALLTCYGLILFANLMASLDRDKFVSGKVVLNWPVVLWQYELMDPRYERRELDFSIEANDANIDEYGIVFGTIEKVEGQTDKKALYTFELGGMVFVGRFTFSVSKYDEDTYHELMEEVPELMEAFAENIEDNDYLVGAEVRVDYCLSEPGFGLRLNFDQRDKRIMLLEPWLARGDRSIRYDESGLGGDSDAAVKKRMTIRLNRRAGRYR